MQESPAILSRVNLDIRGPIFKTSNEDLMKNLGKSLEVLKIGPRATKISSEVNRTLSKTRPKAYFM